MIVKIINSIWEDAMLEIGTLRNRNDKESIIIRVTIEAEPNNDPFSFLGALHVPAEFVGKLYNPRKEYRLIVGGLLIITSFRDDRAMLDSGIPFGQDGKRIRKLLKSPSASITGIKVYSIYDLIHEVAAAYNKINPVKTIVS